MAQSGRKPGTEAEPIRGEHGSKREGMTEAREWPDTKKELRDTNAEHLLDAKKLCEQLGEGGTLESKEAAQNFKAYHHIVDALICMVLAGAPVRPQ